MKPKQSNPLAKLLVALVIVVIVPVVGVLPNSLGIDRIMPGAMAAMAKGDVVNGGLEMVSQATTPLRIGQVLEIRFPTFTPRITIRSERMLTVEIVAGDNAGFSDTVEYEEVVVRDGLVMLSWREHIGSTIVQVLDLTAGEAYAAVTPAKGGFMRLKGRIELK
jgi:hypothetical protein